MIKCVNKAWNWIICSSKGVKWEHGIFSMFMLLTGIFSFFLYASLKDVVSNNFSDPSWYGLKIIIPLIFLFLFITLYPFFVGHGKGTRIVSQYVIYPILIFFILFFGLKGYIGDWAISILIWLSLGIYLISLQYIWKPVNKKIFAIIFITLLLLTIGISFIEGHVGEKVLKLKLNNCSNNQEKVGEIYCQDKLNHVIAGHKVFCELKELKKEYHFESGQVNFEYLNGSKSSVQVSRNEKFSFIVPEKIAYISFKFSNEMDCVSTGNSVNYPEYEEFKSNQKDFMYLILALLGFCLISIPIIVKNFSDMCPKNFKFHPN